MSDNLSAPSYIRGIEPYKAGKPISELAREKGLKPENILKLASNENPLGAPESALQAVREAATAHNVRSPSGWGFRLSGSLSATAVMS